MVLNLGFELGVSSVHQKHFWSVHQKHLNPCVHNDPLKKELKKTHWSSLEDATKPTARDNYYSNFGEYHLFCLNFELYSTLPKQDFCFQILYEWHTVCIA